MSKLWVEERRRTWGEDHPLWQSRVLGDFPEGGTDTVIPLGWASAAQLREIDPPERPPVLGVDVARYGPDDSAIAAVYGPVVTIVEVVGGQDTVTVAGKVRQHATTVLLAVGLPGWSAERLAARLRQSATPVVGRIVEDRLALDLRTVGADEEALLLAALAEAAYEEAHQA